jgi:hypothetical protein
MVIHLWPYCTLIRSILLLLSLTLFPHLLLFNRFPCISLCLIPTQIQWIFILFTLYHSLSLSFPPSPLKLSHYWKCEIHIHMYTYIWSCLHFICIYVYLLDLPSTYERKHGTFGSWTSATLVNMMISTYIHLPANNVSFFSIAE